MSSNLKKTLVLVLALVMMFGILAGCAQTPSTTPAPADDATEAPADDATPAPEGDEEEPPADDATEAPEDGEEEPAPAIDTSEFVTIQHVVLGDPDANGNWQVVQEEWNKYLEEKINCHMELYWTGWTDYLTKYNLMLATGEEIDLVDTASDWLDMWPNAAKGAWLVLDDLIPVYAPLTWAEIPQENWDQCKYQGQIICFPEDCYPQWVNHGMMYRGDWADEAGVPDINSFDELEVYYQWVVDNKSAEGVVPWNATFTSGTGLMGGILEAQGVLGADMPASLYIKSYDEPDVVYAPLMDTEFMTEFATRMKKWQDNGYFRTDVLVDSGIDNRAQMEAGLSASDQHHTETFVGEHMTMERKIPGSDLRFFAWCEESGIVMPYAITHGATSVSVHSPNPERAIMVYEMQRQDETFFHYLQYGIEGWQYVINEDGLRDEPEGYNPDTDGFASNIWGGRPEKFLIPSVKDWDQKDAVYDYMASFSKPNLYGGWVKETESISAEIAAVNEVINSKVPAIAGGVVTDIPAAIEELQTQLIAAGYQTVIDSLQTQLTEYMASK